LRVFTFGIGRDCDKKLVKESAEVGRGINYLIEDSKDMILLKTKIIDALQKAMEPAFDNSILTLTGLSNNKKHVVKLGSIFRSQLVHHLIELDKNDIPNLKVNFTSDQMSRDFGFENFLGLEPVNANALIF
jgi:hypothetical protein